MTQEEKQLLLKDLCARVIYGVHCIVYKMNGDIREEDDTIRYIELDNVITYKSKDDECFMLHQIKPYLRPMESMAEKEKIELHKEHLKDERMFTECIERSKSGDDSMRGKVITHFAADWCNKKMFDYRGLIPMGLALPVKEGMYNN